MFNQPFTPDQLRDPDYLASLVHDHAKRAKPKLPPDAPANEPPPYHDEIPPANEPPSYYDEIPPYDEPKQHSNKKPKIGLSNGMRIYAPTKISWLIKGVLEAGTLAGMFGASGCGKSFTAIDLALSVASDKPYHTFRVNQGSVVYFAGEGQAGIRRRVAAWLQSNPDYQESAANNFYLADRACLLPSETTDVLETLAQVPDLRLVVLDTLQRTFEGDENSTRDMSAYIQAIDDIKANYPNVVFLVVHHTGHSTNDRARGSSVLRASLDAEINVSMDETKAITLKCSKMKDAEEFKPLSFRLKSTPLEGWVDDEGYLIESAIVEYLPSYIPQNKPALLKPNGGNPNNALNILRQCYQEARDNLEQQGYDASKARVPFDYWLARCKDEYQKDNTLFNERYLSPSMFSSRIVAPLEQQKFIRCEHGDVLLLC